MGGGGGRGPFRFVQLELGFLLGPADGRYLTRPAAGAGPERIIVLRTLGAPPRRLLGGRRARRVESAEPEPVPATRATVIRARPFAAEADAQAWLEGLRRDAGALAAEAEEGARDLSSAMRAHRVAAGDPYARDVSPAQANAVRVGYGSGDDVAEGRYAAALEVPRRRRGRERRAERIAPQERLAGILGARIPLLVCEELVLRARADLEARRPREAALETRIALEAMSTELAGTRAGAALGELERHRAPVAEAANAALSGDPPPPLREAVAACVGDMERALRRHRAASLGGTDTGT